MRGICIKIFASFCFCLVLSACSSTQTKQGWDNFLSFFGGQDQVDPNALESLVGVSGTKLILLNTPTIKFYDLAVVRVSYYAIYVDLFQTGVPIGSLEISKGEVCFQGECAPKSLTARKLFGVVSYPDLFDDIFLGNDIFQGKGLRITKNGVLTQRFLLNDQEILYERSADYTIFKNLSNGVVVSIQAYNPPDVIPPERKSRRR